MAVPSEIRTGLSTAADDFSLGSKPVFTRGALSPSAGAPDSTIAASMAREATGRLVFPHDWPLYYFAMGVNNYKRDSWRQVGALEISDNIILPLPSEMVDRQSVDYEEKPIGILGAAALGGAANIRNAFETGDINDLTKGVTGAAERGLSQGLVTQLGVNALQRSGGAQGAGAVRGVLAAAGYAQNDFLTVMLKGPTYKAHTLRWRLSARNAAESQTLAKINKVLNNAQAPGLPRAFGSAFFTYPKIFQLAFRHPAAEGGLGYWTYRFKPCVLKDQQWNFTPNPGGWASYSATRAPESVEVTLHFMELEYWLSGDFS